MSIRHALMTLRMLAPIRFIFTQEENTICSVFNPKCSIYPDFFKCCLLERPRISCHTLLGTGVHLELGGGGEGGNFLHNRSMAEQKTHTLTIVCSPASFG